ncbi:hypothetical protein QQF64_036051, partial [Cirrhinus molitorella]
FDGCGLNETCCKTVSSVLQSNPHLTELDLSINHLQDTGVNLICDGLKSSHCRLKILRLCRCHLTAQSCKSLSLALQSSHSVLRELDLSNNDLQDSGVKLLSDGLKSANSKLEMLRVSICNLTAQSCESLSSVLKSSNTVLRDLDLSNNDLQDSGVILLSEGLKSPNCQMEILRLSGYSVTLQSSGTLERAHRIGPDRDSKVPPQTLIMHFLNYKDKQAAFVAARTKQDIRYNNQQIHFFMDLANGIHQRRKQFDPIRQKPS